MKLFSSILAITSGLEIAKGIKKDVAESLDFFQTVQLRADHLFRDMIEMHRENVPDTDKRNPGHLEADFRKELTSKLASLIGVNNSIRKETKTETNRLHTPFSIFDSSSNDSSAKRPVIVFAHGGGYVAGSVDLYSNFLTHLATETEAIVVAPHYRLAPRRMWPGQFDDVKDVLTWIVDHPEDLENADFSKIIIAGDGLGAAIGVSAAMQVAGNGIKKGEEYVKIPIHGAALLQPQMQMLNFDTPSYRKFNHLTLRKEDMAYSMSSLFAGERDLTLQDTLEYGHLIDEGMKNGPEVGFTDPIKWLSEETLGDYVPESLIYEETEHMWEKKLKNRITNGSVSPIAQYDRILQSIPNWYINANEKDVLHDDAEMSARRLQKLGVNVKYEETKNAMHNNFCWSQAFTGNELVRLGDAQVDGFIAGIKELISKESSVHDEL